MQPHILLGETYPPAPSSSGDYADHPKVAFQSDYSPLRARPRYDRGMNRGTVKHTPAENYAKYPPGSLERARLCALTTLGETVRENSRHRGAVALHQLVPVLTGFGPSRRPRKPAELSVHVSHLIIPACRRGARVALVPVKYDLTPFQRKIVASSLSVPLIRSASLHYTCISINRNFLLLVFLLSLFEVCVSRLSDLVVPFLSFSFMARPVRYAVKYSARSLLSPSFFLIKF